MRKPFKPCQAPGCAKVTQTKYCKEHEHLATLQRRPTAESWRKLYDTARWRRERAAYLAQYPVCVLCGRPAALIDHIKPHCGDLMLFWANWNWQGLCYSCHGRKTAAEDGGFGNRKRAGTEGKPPRTPRGAKKV